MPHTFYDVRLHQHQVVRGTVPTFADLVKKGCSSNVVSPASTPYLQLLILPLYPIIYSFSGHGATKRWPYSDLFQSHDGFETSLKLSSSIVHMCMASAMALYKHKQYHVNKIIQLQCMFTKNLLVYSLDSPHTAQTLRSH